MPAGGIGTWMFRRRRAGSYEGSSCLGLDHDGANRNGNKLRKGTLDSKGSCPREAPTRYAVDMEAFGSCRAVRGVERNSLCEVTRRAGLQSGA